MGGVLDLNKKRLVTSESPDAARPELWGGLECTVNRVGDAWFDQTPRNGHEYRISDLDLFAELGMTSVRYPAVWERISPEDPQVRDFRWTDERLPRLRELGLNPILTLCHHGSGPHYTSMIEDSFAPGLALHAAAVAERYPWVRDYTPVNEPLTTARFSALYGYWYPHTQDEGLFWTALLNEIDATRLSMRAIRAVNPEARLIATDDLGFCHATPPLQHEADFQNERRWVGWDLLCGMVVPGHALWDRLAAFGLKERLRVIADDPCPPAVIGVNHYLASERLLDHRVELHPDRAVADRELGDCGGVPYVDIDAIRNLRTPMIGLPGLLRQAWERYGIPVAVTEVHNGASREEQVRWFVEVWDGVVQLRREGVNIPAVTAWSLLGSHDWNRMVTRFVGHYEVGVYDVRSGAPRPTMLAPVLKDLAQGRPPQAVGLGSPGWWRRPNRFLDASPTGPEYDLSLGAVAPEGERPLLIVGADSPLTRLLVGFSEARGLFYRRTSQPDEALIRAVSPWAVVDGRDWAGVCEDAAALDHAGPQQRFAPPEALVRACAAAGVPCAVFTASTDFEEIDEQLLQLGGPKFLLAGTERMFMPWERARFAATALDRLEFGLPVEVNPNERWDETYAPDVVDAVLDALMDGVAGPLAVVSHERWSVADFVRAVADVAEADPGLVVERPRPTIRYAAPEPEARWNFAPVLPPLETTVERFVRESRHDRRTGKPGVERRADETHLQAAE